MLYKISLTVVLMYSSADSAHLWHLKRPLFGLFAVYQDTYKE